MKYGKIDALMHLVEQIDCEDFDAAKRSCGLKPAEVDHGVVWQWPHIGIGILVAEFGLFVPPLNQHYFAIEGRLYGGNALLYAFDGRSGRTIDMDDENVQAVRKTVRWFANGYDVSQALTRGELIRPTLSLNGAVIWEWPQPKPDLDHLAQRMAKGS